MANGADRLGTFQPLIRIPIRIVYPDNPNRADDDDAMVGQCAAALKQLRPSFQPVGTGGILLAVSLKHVYRPISGWMLIQPRPDLPLRLSPIEIAVGDLQVNLLSRKVDV